MSRQIDVYDDFYLVGYGTTDELTPITYNGLQIKATGAGLLTIDGLNVPTLAIILVKDQMDKKQNGIYRVTNNGTIGLWQLDRVTESLGFRKGKPIYILNGDDNTQTGWTTVHTDPYTVTGVTELCYFPIGGSGGVSSIMGTINQVSVSPSTGAVTVSTPNVFIAPGTIQDTTGMRYSTSSAVVAAGATQGTATTLTSSYNIVVTVPASSGVKLPTPPVGMRVVVVNKGVNNLNVYPDTGGTIDADGINVPLVLHIDASVTLTAASATQWYTVGPPLVAGPGTFVTYGTGRTTVTAIGGGASPLTTKGDIWGYTSGDARVPVGADGQFLAADSGTGTGLIYKNPIIVQEDGVNVASTPHTTLNFTGIVTTSDSGSGVTEINIGGSTGSRVAYVFSNIELEGSSNNYESVDYIRWDSVRNANYTNGVALFETAITDLNLDIRVQDTTNAVTLGQMIGINTSGFHSFPIINPTTNSRMELQIRYSGVGSTFPKIFGPVIEFVNTGVLLSIVQEEYTRTEVNAASYAVTGSDQILAVLYTTTGAVAINLPQIASLPGTKKKKYTIVDEGGNATINNITINAFAGDTIIGVSNFILQSNYNSVTIYNNTVSGWFIASP